jgi:hypothetical protein
MAKVYSETKPSAVLTTSARHIWQTALIGAIVGLLVWGIAWLFQTYLYSVVLCRGDLVARCASAPQYAEATAGIIAAGIGLFALARLQIFRPLPIAIAALISLWGLATLTLSLPWLGAALATLILYGLAYALFGWAVRIRSFLFAMVVLIVLVVVVRLTIVG